MPITTAAEFRAVRGYTGTGFDAAIVLAVAQAQSKAEEFLGRSRPGQWGGTPGGFESAARTYLLSGNGTQELHLPDWPVTTLTSVASVADDGTETAMAATDYRLDGDNGVLHRLPYSERSGMFAADEWGQPVRGFSYAPQWYRGIRNYKVVATAGWTSNPDTRPGWLKSGVVRLVDTLMDERGRSALMGTAASGVRSWTRLTVADQMHLMAGLFAEGRRSVL